MNDMITLAKLKDYISSMQGLYDVVRLVEPGECRVIHLKNQDGLDPSPCYTVWGKTRRCSNCISYQACLTNRVTEKDESFGNQIGHVISMPIQAKTEDGTVKRLSIELVRFRDIRQSEMPDLQEPVYETQSVSHSLSDHILASGMQDSDAGMICFDQDHRCIYANKRAFSLFHVANSLDELGRVVEEWIEMNYQLRNGNIWSQFYRFKHEDRLYRIRLVTVKDEEDQISGYMYSIMDVSDDGASISGKGFRQTHDPLTQLYNQEGFLSAVRMELNRNPNEKYLLIRFNLRNFKLVNTLFGTEKGDEILSGFGHELIRYSEVNEAIAARFYSDQFSIFIPYKNFHEDTIKEAVKNTSKLLSSNLYTLRFQAGIYEISDPNIPVSVMCDRAAMAASFATKQEGLAAQWYSEDIMSNVLQENEVVSGFANALKSHEIEIYLQAQVDENGNVTGAEALSRWNHPVKGRIMPASFIPILEKANLIYQLDYYVWERAAEKLAEWKHTELKDFSISVNISPKDLYYLDILNIFTELVRKYDIDPRKLHLELTETAIATNLDGCIRLVNELQKKNFIVEIDDFGSGYSSLNMLKDIHANVIKLDMGFLYHAEDQDRAYKVIRHVIELGHDLHMDIIAEGVETQEQFRKLKDLGCFHFQGFYFAKPIPVEEFEQQFS